ncbi:unnamed protein product [Bemisia tabaci]|uniref:Uncharacterized protein n=1 Tax=Bemisia tabaci TaxID=7038 RepID=A0A9P0C528_BEMTA|nr:unnamed protein product [Bemisia tabaci]
MTLMSVSLITLVLWSFCASYVNAQYYRLSELTLIPGTFYKTTHPSICHLLAVDSETLIYTMDHNCFRGYTTVVAVKKYSKFANGVRAKEEKIIRYKNFDAKVGAALAKRLIGKKLPYCSQKCNKYKYRFYFLHGKATSKGMCYQLTFGSLDPDCPLQRPLHGLTVNEVMDPAFKLHDEDREFTVDSLPEYPDYEYYYGYLRQAATEMQLIGGSARKSSKALSRSASLAGSRAIA